MQDQANDDAYWKKHVSRETYNALRLGQYETPGTGAYITTENSGIYVCAGCGAALFSSDDKTSTGSGYASFHFQEADSVLELIRTYSLQGEEHTTAVCASCKGRIGTVDDMLLRGAGDLESGKRERTIHASSHALRLRKYFTPANYPVGYLALLLALIAGGTFAWLWGGALLRTAQYRGVDDTVHFWVQDSELSAKTYTVRAENEHSDMPILTDAPLLFIFGPDASGILPMPRGQEVDLVWLDENISVITAHRNVVPYDYVPLKRPDRARFALVTKHLVLNDPVLEPGYSFIVLNKTDLF